MIVKRWSGFYSSGRYDHYLRLSYVLTACFVCCCALTSLPFTIPAIYFAKMVSGERYVVLFLFLFFYFTAWRDDGIRTKTLWFNNIIVNKKVIKPSSPSPA